ncbi:MAG: hypothetical protein QOG34_1621, partial [Frankiaceae bacterium]|nr:hypothetical protein [Frankiaceae bacterium]
MQRNRQRQAPLINGVKGRRAGRAVVLFTVAAALSIGSGQASVVQADQHDSPREIISKRTATSRTFDLGNGRYERRLYALPINRLDHGKWTPIKDGFATATNDLASQGYAWHASAYALDTALKPTMGTDYLSVTSGGDRFGFTLENAIKAPAVTKSGRVRYVGALPATDLRYETMPTGVKEEAILTGPTAPSTLTFALDTTAKDLQFERQADGSWIFFRGTHGRPAFVLTAPFASEGSPDHPRGARFGPERRRHVSLHVRRHAGAITIEMSIDRKWLRDAKRRFPVTVDPTVVVQPPTRDSNFPVCSGCTGADYHDLWVGTSSSTPWRAGMIFDVGQIPADATITSAHLRLYDLKGSCVVTDRPSDTCGSRSYSIEAHRIANAWVTNSLTSSVSYDAAASTTAIPIAAGDQWIDWDMSQTVQDWVSGAKANFGVLLKVANENALDLGGPDFPAATSGSDPTLRPRLDVTYSTATVRLNEPAVVRSNGADLSWDRFDTQGGAFSSYTVYRSPAGQEFKADSSTLLATISDLGTTSFRDTTAAPGKTFAYQVRANGRPSNIATVTLPADGYAKRIISLGGGLGDATYVSDANVLASCANFGADESLFVSGSEVRERSLLRFPINDLPANADVANATLSVFMSDRPAVSETIGAHRVTSDWRAGTGSVDPQSDVVSCPGGGATWNSRSGQDSWGAPGGDFDSTPTSTVTHGRNDLQGWDDFNVTSIAQSWANSQLGDDGILLKAESENGTHGRSLRYYSDDYTVSPALRPRLSITYSDGSHADGPAVSLGPIADGDTVRHLVGLVASATDDHAVSSVEFLVDGTVKATDSSAPYSYSWNSDAVGNGSHDLRVRATDDAGNQTTTKDTTVTVLNSAPPVVRLACPSTSYSDEVRYCDHPDGYWRLGESSGTTASDSSGSGADGTYSGSFALGQPGLLTGDPDTAVKFSQNALGDGKAQLAAVPGGRLTAEAWISTTGPPTPVGNTRILSRGWSDDTVAALDPEGSWALEVSRPSATSSQLSLTFKISAHGTVGTTPSIHSVSASLAPGRSHIAAVFDGQGGLGLYVNGAAVASTNYEPGDNPTQADSGHAVVIGGTMQSDTVIDEAAVSSSVLSADSIRNDYEVGNGVKPTIKGTETVTAAATDDGSVAKVEFFVDGQKFGEDTSSPYSASLDTLTRNVYDGTHNLTVVATDNHGQTTSSSAVPISVTNTAGTRYQGTATASGVPTGVLRKTSGTQDSYDVTVTPKNTSSLDWAAGTISICPRWAVPGASPVDESPVAIPSAVTAGSTAAPVHVTVTPPPLPGGAVRDTPSLQLDLCEGSTRFASKGNAPPEQSVSETLAGSSLGIERYFQYDHQALGAGMTHLVNVATGNSLLRWSPMAVHGRGLSTLVDLTYNGLEDHSKSPAGNNFSLSISTLTRMGTPLDIHPNYVELTDGDGTVLRFVQHGSSSAFDEPSGTNLYLRKANASGAKTWAFTRPDGVTFYFDDNGFPTSTVDANGNTLTYTLEQVPAADDPGGPKWRIKTITDAGGRQTQLVYWTKADDKDPHVRGQLRMITDPEGRKLSFSYYDDGNLLRLTQTGGSNGDGSPMADRSFVFTYTTPSGVGPAITDAATRKNPDPHTPSESSRIYSVINPLGQETKFTYLAPGNGNDKWKLATRTDRDATATSYDYDTANGITTVTPPAAGATPRRTKYTYGPDNSVTKITDAKNRDTVIEWTADRQVKKITEPSGALPVTVNYGYDDNGYLTDATNEVGDHTHLDYDHPAVDGNDVSGNWKTGRTVAHLSQLNAETEPLGDASRFPANSGHYRWQFSHDSKGNLQQVKDPYGAVVLDRPVINADGTVGTSKDGDGNTTTFEAYDPSGLPSRIRDAANQVTRIGYNNDGQIKWLLDAAHAGATAGDPAQATTYYYDSFGRLGRMSQPKSTTYAQGALLWRSVRYDANDNPAIAVGPHEGASDSLNGTQTKYDYDAMDRLTLSTGPSVPTGPLGADGKPQLEPERTLYTYDDAGRLVRVTDPIGVKRMTQADGSIVPDGLAGQFHTVDYGYDEIDRVIRKTRYNVVGGAVSEMQRTWYCYSDPVGDLKWIVAPKANQQSDPCGGAVPDYTTQVSFDDAHRLITLTKPGDPQPHVLRRHFDANGNVDYTEDAQSTRTTNCFDERDRLRRQISPLDKTPLRNLTSQVDFDGADNAIREISPRAWDVSGTASTCPAPWPTSENSRFSDSSQFVQSMSYDPLNRVVKVSMPQRTNDHRFFSYRRYDAAGNLAAVTIPLAVDSTNGFPADIRPTEQTTFTYFDPGWIESENRPDGTPAHFTYRPEGWLSTRTPQRADGTADTARMASWFYNQDGTLASFTDRHSDTSSYSYNPNGELISAHANQALDPGEPRADIDVAYDNLDRQTDVAVKKFGASTSRVTQYRDYDLNGNVGRRVDDIVIDGSGNVVTAGRTHTFGYDRSDWLIHESDDGGPGAASRDIDTTFTPTGWPLVRTVQPTGGGTVRSQTTRTWFDAGLPKTLTITAGGSPRESHTLSYVDSNNNFVDGNRVQDVFSQLGPNTSAACRTSCTETYTYNGPEQVVNDARTGDGAGASRTFSYTPDAELGSGHRVSAIAQEQRVQDQQPNATITTVWDGAVMRSRSANGQTDNFSYDADGNLVKVTGQNPATYDWDALGRLHDQVNAPDTSGTSKVHYTYDALNRLSTQSQIYPTGPADGRPTTYTYQGTTNLVAETRAQVSGGTRTKTYGYDAAGQPWGMTDKRPGVSSAKTFYYGSNPHGDISLLFDDQGRTQAQYGYDAYGNADPALTREIDSTSAPDDPSPTVSAANDPLNELRYGARHSDPVGHSVDMGARRYDPTTAAFLS